MKKKIIFLILIFISIGCSSYKFTGNPIQINSQKLNNKVSDENLKLFIEKKKEKWSLLDVNYDGVPGMSVIKAYDELIKDKNGKKVIVAIIDSGVEIDHPYLSSFIWINSDEIPNNKIDDDKNGFIDDINGWNFLGKSDKENLEYVRLLKKAGPEDKMREVYQNEIDKAIEKNNKTLGRIRELSMMMIKSDSILKIAMGNKDYSLEEAKNLTSKSLKVEESIRFLELAKSNNWSQSRFLDAMDYYETSNNYHNNLEFDGREIVGDDPDNFNDKIYKKSTT